MPEELALAFASCTHAKLGAGCPYRRIPADLVRQVVEMWRIGSSLQPY